MALKAKKTQITREEARTQIFPLDEEIKKLDASIRADTQRLNELFRTRADLILFERTGFHIGDTVLYPVTSGRTKKLTKCVLEYEDRQLFARPFRDDGSLSTRHFYVFEGGYDSFKVVE